jgi:adenosylcobinamide-GDP ribazoletransferase
MRGALAFLSRFPVGGGSPAWEAFQRTPTSFPLSGYVLGVFLAVPFALGLEAGSTVLLYLLAVYGITGITHIDGLADLADAAAVHRAATSVDPEDGTATTDTADTRYAVLKDSSTGVGGALAVALAIVALAFAAASLAPTGASSVGAASGFDGTSGTLRAVGTVVAAEVGAKAGMGVLACLGTPAHEGLGSGLLTVNRPAAYPGVMLAAVPAALLAGPAAVVPLVAVVFAGPVTALVLLRWARPRLGGVSGDVFGATNELGRIAGLHVGVIAWTLS